MVFRQDDTARRHQDWPLRLGQAGTDDVVREHQIKCTHYDAFRFFTPPARPLNAVQPDRESQVRMEQPGCLHASMDVYKWAYKLIPVVPSDLLLDAFVLAKSIRELDMRASPYDLTELGYQPVRDRNRRRARPNTLPPNADSRSRRSCSGGGCWTGHRRARWR